MAQYFFFSETTSLSPRLGARGTYPSPNRPHQPEWEDQNLQQQPLLCSDSHLWQMRGGFSQGSLEQSWQKVHRLALRQQTGEHWPFLRCPDGS